MSSFRAKLGQAAAVVLTVSLAPLGWQPSSRGVEDPLKHHIISVNGTGKISAQPDIAEVTAGVVSHAPTAREALAANNEAMSRMLQILKERGIAEKDIQTSQIEVSPQYSQPPPRFAAQVDAPGTPAQSQAEFVPRIVGYKVDNSVRVTSRRIEQLGPILDAVVQGGANQISGISFRVEHAEKLLDEARKRAIASARHKAELLAGEAGVVLGAPLKIEEQDGGNAPSPQFGRVFRAAAPAPAMAVVPGEQELTVTVSVIYELKQAR